MIVSLKLKAININKLFPSFKSENKPASMLWIVELQEYLSKDYFKHQYKDISVSNIGQYKDRMIMIRLFHNRKSHWSDFIKNF